MLRFLDALLLSTILYVPSADGYTFECVRLPKPPLNGKVRYLRGTIRARLKCKNRFEDLSLNSPGKGGIMTCYSDRKSFDFTAVEKPVCLPKKNPHGLRMPATLSFAVANCTEKIRTDVTNVAMKALENRPPERCSDDMPQASCKWKNNTTRCGENYNEGDYGGLNKLIWFQAELSLEPYEEAKTIEQYEQILAGIRKKWLKNADKTVKAALPSNAKLLKASFYKSWKSSCSAYENVALGTTLSYHKVASCRGCPIVYRYDVTTKSCWQCDRGFSTAVPYSSECKVCQSVETWPSVEQYVKMCGSVK